MNWVEEVYPLIQNFLIKYENLTGHRGDQTLDLQAIDPVELYALAIKYVI